MIVSRNMIHVTYLCAKAIFSAFLTSRMETRARLYPHCAFVSWIQMIKGEIKLKKVLQRFICSFILLTVVACGQGDAVESTGANKDDPSSKVSFVLDWTPNTNHTGIYVAQEKGYFAEQGLEVEIMLPGEVGANQLIASGTADFGVSYQEGLTQARSEGLPLVSIAAVIQHNTAGYASPVDKNIAEPQDFEGAIFGGNGSPLEEAIMKTIMEEENADLDQVDFITLGDADFFAAVQRDVDFSLVFQGWTGIEAELRDVDLNMIYLADFSEQLDFYTPILATSEEMIESDPDTVTAFMEAAAEGYEYAIEHPEEAADILIEQEPDLDPDLVKKSQAWLSPRYQDDAEQWGIQEESRWQSFADFMVEHQIIEEPLDVEDAFTNQFLPK